MTGLDIVRQAAGIDERINGLYERLETLKSRIQGTSKQMDEVGVKPKSGTNKDNIGRYIAIKEDILKNIDILEDMRIKALQIITMIPDPEEQAIIEYYYLCDMSCGAIGDRLHLSKPTIYRKKKHGETICQNVIVA